MVCALEMQLFGVWKAKYPDGHRNEGKCISFPWPQLHTNCSRKRFYRDTVKTWASQVTLVVKILPANAEDTRDVGSIPGSGRSLGGGDGDPLHYSCLGNPMDREAWRATVHGGHKEPDMTEHMSTVKTQPEYGNTTWISDIPSTDIVNGELPICALRSKTEM